MHVLFSSLFFFCSQRGIFTSFENIHAVPHNCAHSAMFSPAYEFRTASTARFIGRNNILSPPSKCALMLCFAFLPGIQASHAVSFVSGSFSNNTVRCRAVNTSGPLLFPQAKLNEVKVTATFFSLDIKLSDLTLVLIKFTRNCL